MQVPPPQLASGPSEICQPESDFLAIQGRSQSGVDDPPHRVGVGSAGRDQVGFPGGHGAPGHGEDQPLDPTPEEDVALGEVDSRVGEVDGIGGRSASVDDQEGGVGKVLGARRAVGVVDVGEEELVAAVVDCTWEEGSLEQAGNRVLRGWDELTGEIHGHLDVWGNRGACVRPACDITVSLESCRPEPGEERRRQLTIAIPYSPSCVSSRVNGLE